MPTVCSLGQWGVRVPPWKHAGALRRRLLPGWAFHLPTTLGFFDKSTFISNSCPWAASERRPRYSAEWRDFLLTSPLNACAGTACEHHPTLKTGGWSSRKGRERTLLEHPLHALVLCLPFISGSCLCCYLLLCDPGQVVNFSVFSLAVGRPS